MPIKAILLELRCKGTDIFAPVRVFFMHCVRKQSSFLMNIKVVSIIMLTFAGKFENQR